VGKSVEGLDPCEKIHSSSAKKAMGGKDSMKCLAITITPGT